jgi:hypothetical protein
MRGYLSIVIAGLFLSMMGCDKLKEESNRVTVVPPVVPPVITQEALPCTTQEIVKKNDTGHIMVPVGQGYQYYTLRDRVPERPLTHCLPCKNAKTKGELFVCEGDGKEDESKGTPIVK